MSGSDTESMILAACEEQLARRTAWDEPPELLVVLRTGGAEPKAVPIPVSLAVWDAMPTAMVVLACAESFTQFGLIAGDSLVAVALRYEGFAITSESSPQAAEAIRRKRAGGSVPPNAEIPGRIEQRIISARDVHGRHYIASADRRSDGGATPVVSKVIGAAQQMTGAIPDALNALIAALRPPTAHQSGACADHL
ncbi:hypothetical protein [Streptantibioticus ferralitis]|uniref:Uncharacterized protein n=1 Tax=Streptantibioticus ferralitis TaxID=236510 RepID=A0ABT5YZZ1_9ACTN|nr:hypothetical protein [Streptantibioticus ferralitis]MDF2257168.1 hypothetical protein [Streptantibioticus ferralitis]